MTDEFTTEQLEVVLASIGRHLEIPQPTIELVVAGPTGESPTRRRRWTGLLATAASVAIVLGGVALVPSTRAAVADLLGIGSTRVEITGEDAVTETDLPQVASGLTRITVDDATTILGGDLPDGDRTALGPPEAIYRMPEGGVLLAWQEDTATLWIRPTTDADVILRKLLGSGESVETVDDLGTEALLITDAHLLQTPRRRLAAQQVLLWYDDDREYRLEASTSPAELIELARDLGRR